MSNVTNMLKTCEYVRIIAIDYSKAFDTVKHSELGRKLATVPIWDQVYNWIVNYIDRRGTHRTKIEGQLSASCEINASVVQGSAVGPVSYILTSRDLKTVDSRNCLIKYADDTYLLVASTNEKTVNDELANIEKWAENNNLKLNRRKSKELIVGGKLQKSLMRLMG